MAHVCAGVCWVWRIGPEHRVWPEHGPGHLWQRLVGEQATEICDDTQGYVQLVHADMGYDHEYGDKRTWAWTWVWYIS